MQQTVCAWVTGMMIALIGGPGLRGAETVTAKGATSLAELRAQIESHVTQERFRSAVWGIKVSALATGQTLFEHHADRLLSPASNTKLYTGALALDRLGGDYRIITPIMATALPDATGTLVGDLVVSGRGDPSWNSGRERKGFEAIFEPFVAAIEAAGVRRITGGIVSDATFFRGVPNGAGWTADDLNDYYGAEISAVTIEDNYADLQIAPGDAEGGAAIVTLRQPETGLVLDNRIVTRARDSGRRVEVRRIFGENVVHVFGQVPLGGAVFDTEVTVSNPGRWFANALKAALQRKGIVVEGGARSVRWPDAAPQAKRWVQLGEVVSPPLRELVESLMKPSQNLQTDLIFAHVGEMSRTGDVPNWRSSEACGVLALREFLQANRLEPDDVRFEEGSGLSRNNLTTARATVALLTFMTRHREAEAFRASLPIAGVDGTLRRRMQGTAAEGNLRAKTGTLRWANSLSGYVTTAGGEDLVFSLMLNRAVVAPGASARDDIDAIARMLAEFAGRSGGAASE